MATSIPVKFGAGRQLNYRSSQVGDWKCELWTGGSVYETRSAIDLTIQLNRKVDKADGPWIRNLHVKLVQLNHASPVLERRLAGVAGDRVKDNLLIFRYEDLFSARLPIGQQELTIDITLEDNEHWSTQVPISVIASPGERNGSKQ